MSIYLDNNATAPSSDPVKEAIARTLDDPQANPSSAHSSGQLMRGIIERARERLADWLGGFSENYIFTSGCTEANNTVVRSVAIRGAHRARIAVSAIEHPSVLGPCESLEAEDGMEVTRVPVDKNGRLDLSCLISALETGVELVCVQWVNSEIGVVQDIDTISGFCRKYGAKLHVDAAQAVGRLALDVSRTPVDFLSFSGHKLHALPGIGVLYAADPSSVRPLIYGGGQERGMRSGTENWIGIATLEAALADRMASLQDHIRYMCQLRDVFEDGLLESSPWVVINGRRATTVCNTSNVRFPGIDGQALVARLDRKGVICSQTSACSSSRPEPSYVLRAIGLSEDDAYSSVRFSVSVLNSLSEIEEAVEVIAGEANALRALCAPADTTPKTLEQETLV